MGFILKLLKGLFGKGKPPPAPRPPPPARPPPQPARRTEPGCTRNCGRLPKPAQRPLRRHDLCRAKGDGDRTRSDVNSMVDTTVDVAADMAELNAGNFTTSGSNYVVNGRTYGMHPETGRTFPISGPGIHQFSRAEHQFLRKLNENGLDAARQFGRNLPGLSAEAMARVEGLWRMCGK
jgi:hypothetical protein